MIDLPPRAAGYLRRAQEADMTPLYYECHITIDPVVGEQLDKVNTLAATSGFKVANLMKATGEPNDKDAFMTAHAAPNGLVDLRTRMANLVASLLLAGFIVRRFKIEAVIEDSRKYGQPSKA
jgi:hypothetical protein